MDRKQDAWVKMPSAEQAAGDAIPDGHPYDFGYRPAMGRLIGAHPRLAPYFGALFGQIMFIPGALSRVEREMIAGVAAAAQDCHY